jgi:hypothetical protein
MCHECGDEDDDVQFSSDFVDEINRMPEDEKEYVITDMQESMAYVIKKAEQQGILFEMITSWPKLKIALYEAAAIFEKNVLEEQG